MWLSQIHVGRRRSRSRRRRRRRRRRNMPVIAAISSEPTIAHAALDSSRVVLMCLLPCSAVLAWNIVYLHLNAHRTHRSQTRSSSSSTYLRRAAGAMSPSSYHTHLLITSSHHHLVPPPLPASQLSCLLTSTSLVLRVAEVWTRPVTYDDHQLACAGRVNEEILTNVGRRQYKQHAVSQRRGHSAVTRMHTSVISGQPRRLADCRLCCLRPTFVRTSSLTAS